MSDLNLTLAAAAAAYSAHAGAAAKRVVKSFFEASTITVSGVVLKPPLDAL